MKKTELFCYIAFFILACLILMCEYALALSEPTKGTFSYNLYDIIVNKIIKGPIGFVLGTGSVVYGGIQGYWQE